MRIVWVAVLVSLLLSCDERNACDVMDGGQLRICNHLMNAGASSLDCNYRKNIEYSCIENLTELKSASFIGTSFSEFRLMARNKGLQYLAVDSQDVVSLDGIEMFQELEELLVAETGVTDLGPLVALKKLNYLNISETDVDDIEPLLEIESLRVLVAVKAKVPCEQLERLRRTNPKVETFVLEPDEYIHFPESDAPNTEKKSGPVSNVKP